MGTNYIREHKISFIFFGHSVGLFKELVLNFGSSIQKQIN